MGVKFSIVGSPTTWVPFECNCVMDGTAWPGCTICNGTGTATYPKKDWGEVEVSNMTASAMLRCIGIEFEPSGDWSLEELPQIRRKIITVLNRHDGTLRGEEDPIDEERYHYAGISKERLVHRFQELLALIVEAQGRGCAMVWD